MPNTVQNKKRYLDERGLSLFWEKIQGYVNTADGTKISEVLPGNGIEVTGDREKTVAVKVNNAGNVKFTADTNGLKADVDIPVKGVAANDNFLSLTDKLISADVTLGYDQATKQIRLYGKDKTTAASFIDATDFVKDGILDKVELTANDKLVFTWNTDAGKNPTSTTIDLAKFIDTTEFNGENLKLTGLSTVETYDDPANNDSLNTAIAKLTFGVKKAMQDAVAGVTSFGDKTGAITVDTVGEGNGNVKFTMGADKMLKASVTGLGTAAYTESSAYANAEQGTKADTALQSLSTSGDGDYVTTTVGKEGTVGTIGVAVTIQDISTADASHMGVLEASNAKTYIDTQIDAATGPIPDNVINALF